MLLTLQDTGVPHVTLHGPPGIVSILKQLPGIFNYILCTQVQSGLPSVVCVPEFCKFFQTLKFPHA